VSPIAGPAQGAEQAVAGVVEQHVDAAEARHGGVGRRDGLRFVGDVERDAMQVVTCAEGGRDVRGLAGGGDDEVAPLQYLASDFKVETAGRPGDEPDSLLGCGHVDSFGDSLSKGTLREQIQAIEQHSSSPIIGN
jgi:hypothetical protein